jgi:hypothetical protein
MGLDNPLHTAVLVLVLALVFRRKRLAELGDALRAGLSGFRESLAGKRVPRPVTVQPRLPSAPVPDDEATAWIIVGVAQPAPVRTERAPGAGGRLR